MNWKAKQLIFPLLAVLIWPVAFTLFGDDAGVQANQVGTMMPLVSTKVNVADNEPGRVPILKIRGEPESPYVAMAVAEVYDGQKWELQDVADLSVFDELDLSQNSGIAVRQTLYPSIFGADEAVLRTAFAADDPAHLILPENTSSRVRNLAEKITEGLSLPFEKAEAIEAYLKIRYVYNLDFESTPAEFEPNDWFLFESQQGVCTHFNSAFVMLARAAGIPARLVVGYYVEADLSSQTVYSDQAHAWAEIHLDGIGWNLFDATPPAYIESL